MTENLHQHEMLTACYDRSKPHDIGASQTDHDGRGKQSLCEYSQWLHYTGALEVTAAEETDVSPYSTIDSCWNDYFMLVHSIKTALLCDSKRLTPRDTATVGVLR